MQYNSYTRLRMFSRIKIFSGKISQSLVELFFNCKIIGKSLLLAVFLNLSPGYVNVVVLGPFQKMKVWVIPKVLLPLLWVLAHLSFFKESSCEVCGMEKFCQPTTLMLTLMLQVMTHVMATIPSHVNSLGRNVNNQVLWVEYFPSFEGVYKEAFYIEEVIIIIFLTVSITSSLHDLFSWIKNSKTIFW